MHSFAWWPTLVVLGVAVVTDISSRRIPNWVSLPFLAAGIAVNAVRGGWPAIGQSAAGVGIAVAVLGVFCYLRGIGLGDLKLCAGVGAWVGPGQLVMALVSTGIAGGVLAIGYVLMRGSVARSLDNTAELITGVFKRPFRAHPAISLGNAAALKMPYAPAIAIGTIFSFFTI
jgi:prepilin peptidase CpaA